MSARYARHLAGATLAAFVLSSTWYVGFDGVRTGLLADLGVTTEPPSWLAVLEPLRTLAVAVAIGTVVRSLGARTPREAIRVGIAAFAAFPAVLLIGSVIHGESSAGLAAIHAGDWLLKLVVIALVMRRHYAAPAPAPGASFAITPAFAGTRG